MILSLHVQILTQKTSLLSFLFLPLIIDIPNYIDALEASVKKQKKINDDVVKSKCSSCQKLTAKFIEGLEKTRKSGYGGGNTAWEEKSLGKGSFANSETRFLEIIENVCSNYSGESEKFYCHSIVEQHEETIQHWFLNERNGSKNLFDYLCIKKLKLCCSTHRWGPQCVPCKNGTEAPCSGQGDCDGSGTRAGTGKCTCNTNNEGEACEKCRTEHWKDGVKSNTTHVICSSCHKACGDEGCDGGGVEACSNCGNGFKSVSGQESLGKGCEDVDECEDVTTCNSATEFCLNLEGSFKCEKCDEICDPEEGCHGDGPGGCKGCREGAQWDMERKECMVSDQKAYDIALEKEAGNQNADDVPIDSDGDDQLKDEL